MRKYLTIWRYYYHRLGSVEKANKSFETVENIYLKVLGEEHPEHAILIGVKAVLVFEAGDFEKAEAMFTKSLNILEKNYGKGNEYYLGALMNRAAAYYRKGNMEETKSIALEVKRDS